MADGDSDDGLSVERLTRALERERKARTEAEAIAERGLRDLWEINQDLDQRVRERTAEAEAAREEAESANASKTVFLANLSHEVRTPMNGIMGMLELLASADLQPSEQDWVASARASAERLHSLFVRLVQYIELEDVAADDAALQVTVPVSTVLERVLERWKIPCARAGQLLSLDNAVGSDLHVDRPAEVGRLLDELLRNASVHGDPGPVTVSAATADDFVRFSVADTGPGIDPEMLEDFDRLTQPLAWSTQRGDLGAGLGFAIVARLVLRLGGRWGVSSDARGTTAWVDVPGDTSPAT